MLRIKFFFRLGVWFFSCFVFVFVSVFVVLGSKIGLEVDVVGWSDLIIRLSFFEKVLFDCLGF